ncbi:hypothetical protein U6A24_02285 [Aquimarina gracilis]|uniref:Secreted protein n=1 Tax=Aquimarina gracilis TaxID=874422 RepID=A0ABU5ZRQ9_9FLAO|nr:hypothetical protein [Aquimarina gracilis]MEB3344267.1 hypothetical protein [Aquimarina gracilis]
MKKVFLTVSTVFTLALIFSVNFQNNDLVQNSAFADGTCCPEEDSLCRLNGEWNRDYYYKTSGSCSGDSDF